MDTPDAAVDAPPSIPGNFSCQSMAYPSTAPDPVVASGTVSDEHGTGIDAVIELHAVSNDAFVAQGMASAHGLRPGGYGIDVPTGGVAPVLYRKVTSSGNLDSYVYDGRPLSRTYPLLTLTQSAAAIDGYAASANVTVDPARGTVLLIIGDCTQPPSAAVAGATIDPPPGSTLVYVDDQGLPDRSRSATGALGQALILNAPTGLADITVHAGPVVYRASPIMVRAGAFTSSFRYP